MTAARVARAVADPPPDTRRNLASIVETHWRLHQRPRDAWTFERDLRPMDRPGERDAHLAHRAIPAIEARTGARFGNGAVARVGKPLVITLDGGEDVVGAALLASSR